MLLIIQMPNNKTPIGLQALLLGALALRAKKGLDANKLKKSQSQYLKTAQGIPEALRYAEPGEGIKQAAAIQSQNAIADRDYELKKNFYQQVSHPGELETIKAQGSQQRETLDQQQRFDANQARRNRIHQLYLKNLEIEAEDKKLDKSIGAQEKLTRLQGEISRQNTASSIGMQASKEREMALFNRKQLADENAKLADEIEANAEGFGIDSMQAKGLASLIRNSGDKASAALGYGLNFIDKYSNKRFQNKLINSFDVIDNPSLTPQDMDDDDISSMSSPQLYDK